MDQAEAFRKRAAEVRRVAQNMTPGLRIAMLAMADQWETLARQVEYLSGVRSDLKRI